MKRVINIGLIGLGTVGQGVFKILRNNSGLIDARACAGLNIRKICDQDLRPRQGLKLDRRLLTKRPLDILDDPSIDVVVELIGGIESARNLIKLALSKGKHVVTANKAVLANHWDEIMSAARKAGKEVFFEASVGGGIPLIRSLHDGLSANKIKSIWGVVNGTTNYILTEMRRRNIEFPAALAEAQKRGYAEADPSFDINGIDAAHKLAILANLSFNQTIKVRDIYTEGISRISRIDMLTAEEEFDQVIKLLAIARVVNNRLEVRVHPALIPKSHPVARLDGCLNGIHFIGDSVGPVMFQGAGAGQLPAASAVVSDIIYLARNVIGAPGLSGASLYQPGRTKLAIRPIGDIRTRYYLRFMVTDRPGVLATISGMLGRCGISIASAIQEEGQRGQKVAVIMTTYEARESDVQRALARINSLRVVRDKTLLIRMEKD